MTSGQEHLWQHSFITTNGVKLHYITQGQGSLMLMLHGFPEFWYSWRHQIPVFAQHYKVVVPDLRGYNESEKPQKQSAYVREEFVRDIKGMIEGLGYERCVLVGHDWGGLIAWTFAYAYPELVDRLIVLNLPHPAKFIEAFWTNPRQVLRSWYIFFFQLPWFPELVLQWNDYRLIGEMLADTASNKTAFTPADLEAYRDAAKRGSLTAMINYYRNILFDALKFQQQWGVLEVPTLMIWGEKDVALGKELTYGTETYVQNLRIRYLPECGHWVQQECPELVNQYMQEFLER